MNIVDNDIFMYSDDEVSLIHKFMLCDECDNSPCNILCKLIDKRFTLLSFSNSFSIVFGI